MAYFDSPKNRAKWNIELNVLRQEKEDRRNGIIRPSESSKRMEYGMEERSSKAVQTQMENISQSKGKDGYLHEQVTYQELVAEEQAEHGRKPIRQQMRSTEREKDREVTKTGSER